MKNAHKKFREPINTYDDTLPSKVWIEMQEFEGGKPKVETPVETTIFDIPHELWPLILQNFDRAELARFMKVCRTFKEVAQEEPIYNRSNNDFIRSIFSDIKKKVTAVEWPKYISSTTLESWNNGDGKKKFPTAYVNVTVRLNKLYALLNRDFGNTFANKPFVKAMGELKEYWRNNPHHYSEGNLQQRVQFFEFVDKKYKEIAKLLEKENKTRKNSFFHRERPPIIEDLCEIMKLLVKSAPVVLSYDPYYQRPNKWDDNPFAGGIPFIA